jgi:RNA polymerase primary sigma factor
MKTEQTEEDRMAEQNREQSLEEFLKELSENEEIVEARALKDEDLFAFYSGELADVAPLAPGEEEKLLQKLLAGGAAKKAAADRLAEGKLSRTLEIAREYENQGVPLNDLIQEASIGLMTAISEYSGGDFEQLSEERIRSAIGEALADQKREKEIAENMRARVNVLRDVSQAMAKDLGRAPTVPELADKMKMTEMEIRDIMKVMLDAMNVKSEDMADNGIDASAFTDSSPLAKDYPEDDEDGEES